MIEIILSIVIMVLILFLFSALKISSMCSHDEELDNMQKILFEWSDRNEQWRYERTIIW